MIASALFPNVASDATARSADAAPASDTQPRATELDDMIAELVTLSLSSERPPRDELAQDDEGAERDDALCREQMVASAAPPTPRVGAADLAWLASQTTEDVAGSPSETRAAPLGARSTSLGHDRDEPLPPTVRVPAAGRAPVADLGGEAGAAGDLDLSPLPEAAAGPAPSKAADGALAASATALAPPDDPFVEPPPSSGPSARRAAPAAAAAPVAAPRDVAVAPAEIDRTATTQRPGPPRRYPTPVSTRATTVTPPANAATPDRAQPARAEVAVAPGAPPRELAMPRRPAARVDAATATATAPRDLLPDATAGLYREIREVRGARDGVAPAGAVPLGEITSPDEPFVAAGASANMHEQGRDDEERSRGEATDPTAIVEGRGESRHHVGATGHAASRELHRHVDHAQGAAEVRDARELESAKIELSRGGAARGTLDLPDTGRVEVMATRHEGNLEVRVDAQREAVAQVLAAEAPRLSAELSTAGIDARVLVGEGGAGAQSRHQGDTPRDPGDAPRDDGAAQPRMHPASNRRNRFVL